MLPLHTSSQCNRLGYARHFWHSAQMWGSKWTTEWAAAERTKGREERQGWDGQTREGVGEQDKEGQLNRGQRECMWKGTEKILQGGEAETEVWTVYLMPWMASTHIFKPGIVACMNDLVLKLIYALFCPNFSLQSSPTHTSWEKASCKPVVCDYIL